jgi:hypothetical protein
MTTALSTDLSILGAFVIRLVAALLVLLIGWLIARFIAGIVRRLLGKTHLDDRVANAAAGENVPRLEETISSIVFYILMLFVVVAFFEVLGLTLITEPLNALIAIFLGYLPKLLAAAALVVIAWIVARILRGLVRRVLEATGVDKRLAARTGDGALPVSGAIAEAVYWLVWLIFLPPILGALGMTSLVEPLTAMFTEVLAFLPQLFAAALLMVVGWFVARIVQRIVTSFLVAIGTDRLGERVGLTKVTGKQTLSGLLGLLVFVLILIPAIIAALNALGLAALTAPLTAMLADILRAIPAVFMAFVVIAIAYVVGRLVGDLVAGLLSGIGFDNVLVKLGVAKEPTVGKRSPSQIIGVLVMVAIILLATMGATALLQWAALTALLSAFLVFAFRIIVGLVIFGLGLWLASVLGNAVMESDWPQKRLAAIFVRVAVIALAGAMALSQMGLANDIVVLAFGLTLGGMALAIGLAFGLGGQKVAGKQLEEWSEALKSEDTNTE